MEKVSMNNSQIGELTDGEMRWHKEKRFMNLVTHPKNIV
jgi:hypothetical protein